MRLSSAAPNRNPSTITKTDVGQTGNVGLKELMEDVNKNSDLLPGSLSSDFFIAKKYLPHPYRQNQNSKLKEEKGSNFYVRTKLS